MTARSYANAAPQLTLNSPMTAGATSMVVSGTFSGWPPAFPFFAILEYGTINMEIVSVTGISGSTATVVRGQDGTAAVSHLAGATVNHGVVRQDLAEANAHINATTGVHGTTGALVDTTSTQTLSGKTLTTPTLTSPTSSNPTFTGTATGASANFSGSLFGGSISSGGPVTAGGNSPVSGVIVPKAYANATARDAALTSPTAGTVVWLTSPGALFQFDGTNWNQIRAITDTGWQSPGLSGTQPTGATITSQRYRQINNVMWIYIAGTLGTTCAGHLNGAGGSTGDYANEVIVTTLGAPFRPAQFHPLSSGASGANYSWTINTDGSLSINAGPAAPTVSAASTWSVGGSYLLD